MALRGARLLLRIVGMALLVVPLLPVSRWAGPDDLGPVWGPNVAAWGLGLAMVGVLALAFGRLQATRPLPRLRVPRVSTPLLVGVLAVGTVAIARYAMLSVFSGNPHTIDEMAQLFQARIFASGRLAAPPPVPAEAFLMMQTFVVGEGWTAQFPPGHSALLAIGLLTRTEWLINPVLAGVGTVLVFLVARGLYGPATGRVAAFLWATSAWVIFMSGTYQNHVTATTLALAAWAAVFGPKHPRAWHLVLAGLALAAAGATRPLDAVAAGVPILAWFVLRHRWRDFGWTVLGGVPVLLAVTTINWKLFGNPFTLGYSALYGEAHSIGFHVDPWGEEFTLTVAMHNLVAALRRLHIYVYEWPIPALLPLGVWALFATPRRRHDLIVALGIVAAPLFYFFYWHSGFYPGPRSYYAAVPFPATGTARAWRWASIRTRRQVWPHVRLDSALAAAAVVVLGWGAIGVFPLRARMYHQQFENLKSHPERELAEAGVEEALVIVPESWGSRLITPLWAMGVPASLVERAYRRLDACELDEFVHHVRDTGVPVGDVTTQLAAMVEAVVDPPPRVIGAPDPSLKLWPRERLPESCRRQLERDLRGFALYGNLGWRNAVGLSSGVVFARDMFDRNDELFARYAGWPVWRYAPPVEHPDSAPVLQLIRPRGSDASDPPAASGR